MAVDETVRRSGIDAIVNQDNAGAVASWNNAGFGVDPHDGRWSFVV